jgi:hypothetical protein
VDSPFQAYLIAAQWMMQNDVPLNVGNPYVKSSTQEGFQTFGEPHCLSLLAEVSNRALKAVWFHKWYVHRTLRPEAYGGLVHWRTGAVTVVSRWIFDVAFAASPQSGLAWSCFLFQLIEPDWQISRIKCARAHLMRYVSSPFMWRRAGKALGC